MKLTSKIIILVSTVCLSGMAMLGLFLYANQKIHYANHFTRIFPPHPIEKKAALDLQFNSYYFAGADSGELYLGNETNAGIVLGLDSGLQVSRHCSVAYPTATHYSATQLMVSASGLYATDLVDHRLYNGPLRDSASLHFVEKQDPSAETVLADQNTLLMRSFSPNRNSYWLKKKSISTSRTDSCRNIFEPQGDSLFSVDGALQTDLVTKQIIYMYYYRNLFYVLDSNLHTLLRAHTIDTNTNAKISVGWIPARNIKMLSAPPMLANRKAAAWNNHLFVQSGLMANNENPQTFSHAAVIDVYSLSDGHYQFSFYLHNYDNKILKSFAIFNNILYAIFDRWIVGYQLHSLYFRTGRF